MIAKHYLHSELTRTRHILLLVGAFILLSLSMLAVCIYGIACGDILHSGIIAAIIILYLLPLEIKVIRHILAVRHHLLRQQQPRVHTVLGTTIPDFRA